MIVTLVFLVSNIRQYFECLLENTYFEYLCFYVLQYNANICIQKELCNLT